MSVCRQTEDVASSATTPEAPTSVLVDRVSHYKGTAPVQVRIPSGKTRVVGHGCI